MGGDAVVGVFVQGQVGHEMLGAGSVPVLLVGLEAHGIAGADDLGRRAAAPSEPHAFGDVQDLAQGVSVPGRAGAGGEVNAHHMQPGRVRRGREVPDTYTPPTPNPHSSAKSPIVG